jgi:hypothetical protein
MTGDVRLELDLSSFDDEKFRQVVDRCERQGITFTTMAELGDDQVNRRKLYELNRECSLDIPGRGTFYSYPEYLATRLDRPEYLAEATFLALDGWEWVGMSSLSDWRFEASCSAR